MESPQIQSFNPFPLNSIDYLLKSYDEIAIQKALVKFKRIRKSFQATHTMNIDAIQKLLEQTSTKNYKKRFIAKLGDQYKQIETDEIAYFFAEGNTFSLVTDSNRHYIIDLSLEDVARKIDPSLFLELIGVIWSEILQLRKYISTSIIV